MSDFDHEIVNPIPPTLLNLLSELSTISKLKRGDKMNVKTRSFTSSDSYVGSIQRWYNEEDRVGLISYLDYVINWANESLKSYEETPFVRNIINALSAAVVGIQNLMVTYKKSPDTVSSLEVRVANINIQLQRNNDLLNGRQKQ